MKIDEKNSPSNDLDYKAKTFMDVAWLLASGATVVPIIGYIFVRWFKVDFSALGPFGDYMAGSTVPLLTFASFILLAATLFMQQNQLIMQREELKLTREEYAKTNEAFNEQNKMIAVQRFENTYFILLEKLHQNNLSISANYKLSVADHYETIFLSLKRYIQKHMDENPVGFEATDDEFYEHYYENLEGGYMDFLKGYFSDVNPYYGLLQQMLILLDRNSIYLTEDERKYYLHFIIIELPNEAINLMFYDTIMNFRSRSLLYRVGFIDFINPRTLYNSTDEELFFQLLKKDKSEELIFDL